MKIKNKFLVPSIIVIIVVLFLGIITYLYRDKIMSQSFVFINKVQTMVFGRNYARVLESSNDESNNSGSGSESSSGSGSQSGSGNQYNVSFGMITNGGDVIGPTGRFNEGTVLTYQAKADKGYVFIDWEGACARFKNKPVCTITLNSDISIGAYFDSYRNIDEAINDMYNNREDINTNDLCLSRTISQGDEGVSKYVGINCTLSRNRQVIARYDKINLTGTKCDIKNGGCFYRWFDEITKKEVVAELKCERVIVNESQKTCGLSPLDPTPVPRGDPKFCLYGTTSMSDFIKSFNDRMLAASDLCKVTNHSFKILSTPGKVPFFTMDKYNNLNLIEQMTKIELKNFCDAIPACSKQARQTGQYDDYFGKSWLQQMAKNPQLDPNWPNFIPSNTSNDCKSIETWTCESKTQQN